MNKVLIFMRGGFGSFLINKGCGATIHTTSKNIVRINNHIIPTFKEVRMIHFLSEITTYQGDIDEFFKSPEFSNLRNTYKTNCYNDSVIDLDKVNSLL